jgi:hypothetical protein
VSSRIVPALFGEPLQPDASLAQMIKLIRGKGYTIPEATVELRGVTAAAPGDWTLDVLTPLFVVAISILGLTTTVGARWIDRVGPPAALFGAACCFGVGIGGVLTVLPNQITQGPQPVVLGQPGLIPPRVARGCGG